MPTAEYAINVAGAEILNVRDVCERFGRLMDVPVRFTHQESDSAFLNDGRAGYPLLGTPRVDAESMIRWTADWVDNGRENIGKPTRFQVRDGRF